MNVEYAQISIAITQHIVLPLRCCEIATIFKAKRKHVCAGKVLSVGLENYKAAFYFNIGCANGTLNNKPRQLAGFVVQCCDLTR